MDEQKHSFWRLIFLSHFFYEAFAGCFKVEPCAAQGNRCQSWNRRLLQHYPLPRRAGQGAAGVLGSRNPHPKSSSTIHNCSITSFLPQMGLWRWQEWLFVWACNCHAQPWPSTSIPPDKRAAGTISAPAALLTFSRLEFVGGDVTAYFFCNWLEQRSDINSCWMDCRCKWLLYS